MSEECVDLKNIKYQTMLLNGNSKIDSDKVNTPNVEDLLSKENTENKLKPWSKLGTTEQYKKIDQYISTIKPKARQKELKIFLFKSLKNKKIQRTKDVVYDAVKGIIKSIPGLKFDTNKNRFTLKRIDKKNSTLKGLPIKHRKKTQKYKKQHEENKKTSKEPKEPKEPKKKTSKEPKKPKKPKKSKEPKEPKKKTSHKKKEKKK